MLTAIAALGLLSACATPSDSTEKSESGATAAAVPVMLPWWVALTGAGGVLLVAVLTQLWISSRSKAERRSDRRLLRLDSLVVAFEDLDHAFNLAARDDSPEADTSELIDQRRKFERSVALVHDEDIRRKARECAALTAKFAATRNEPDESEGPTPQEVMDNQAALMDLVRKCADKIR